VIYRYATNTYIGRYCLPDKDDPTVKSAYDDIWGYLDIETITGYINDVAYSWAVILIGFFIAFIFCIIFMYLVEWFAAVLAWICIIGSIACLIGLGCYFWFTADDTNGSADNDEESYNKTWAILFWIGAALI